MPPQRLKSCIYHVHLTRSIFQQGLPGAGNLSQCGHYKSSNGVAAATAEQYTSKIDLTVCYCWINLILKKQAIVHVSTILQHPQPHHLPKSANPDVGSRNPDVGSRNPDVGSRQPRRGVSGSTLRNCTGSSILFLSVHELYTRTYIVILYTYDWVDMFDLIWLIWCDWVDMIELIWLI